MCTGTLTFFNILDLQSKNYVHLSHVYKKEYKRITSGFERIMKRQTAVPIPQYVEKKILSFEIG